MPELIPGPYERLLTVELRRLVSTLDAGRAEVGSPDAADAHTAVAGYLRGIIERALHAVPEDERLTRQAEISNALLEWLKDEQRSASVEPEDALVVPLTVLREVRALARGAALSGTTPQPLVPLSAADLMVNARGEPSVGAAIEREIHSHGQRHARVPLRASPQARGGKDGCLHVSRRRGLRLTRTKPAHLQSHGVSANRCPTISFERPRLRQAESSVLPLAAAPPIGKGASDHCIRADPRTAEREWLG